MEFLIKNVRKVFLSPGSCTLLYKEPGGGTRFLTRSFELAPAALTHPNSENFIVIEGKISGVDQKYAPDAPYARVLEYSVSGIAKIFHKVKIVTWSIDEIF